MRKFIIAIALLALTGCTWDEAMQRIDAAVTRTDAAVAKYAPLIGRDLIMVGDIVITAECSPMMPVAGQAAGNLLQVVAPSGTAAAKVEEALANNDKIASQLCPLVAAIKTQVGAVPKGAPSQVVAIPPAPAA